MHGTQLLSEPRDCDGRAVEQEAEEDIYRRVNESIKKSASSPSSLYTIRAGKQQIPTTVLAEIARVYLHSFLLQKRRIPIH
jgi:hypothetical protein